MTHTLSQFFSKLMIVHQQWACARYCWGVTAWMVEAGVMNGSLERFFCLTASGSPFQSDIVLKGRGRKLVCVNTYPMKNWRNQALGLCPYLKTIEQFYTLIKLLMLRLLITAISAFQYYLKSCLAQNLSKQFLNVLVDCINGFKRQY